MGGTRALIVVDKGVAAAGLVAPVQKALEARFPGLGDYVDRRMAIAIDGEIHQDAWTSPLKPDSEVYFIPKIGGG